jgi:twitching motility protein PilT
MSTRIDDLLRMAMSFGASDLHLRAGSFPVIRVTGELKPLSGVSRLTQDETLEMAFSMMSNRQKQHFKEAYEVDIGYGVSGLGRFRVNIFQQRNSIGIVARVISDAIRGFAELGLPPILNSIANESRGLILVTGTTGSGKSTTLAAIVDHINQQRNCHIVTIEDPIEFLHKNKESFVTQREVDVDTRNFAEALRGSLRQDPDVILVGEMRGALDAAHSGCV